MDDKKKLEGGFGTSTDRPREQWGAAEREDIGGARYAAGQVRGARDISDDERGQLLTGYTTGSEDERIEAASFDRDQGSPGFNVQGAGTTGMSMSGNLELGIDSNAGAGSQGKVAHAKETVKAKAGEAKAKVAQTAKAKVEERKGEVADRLEGLSAQLHDTLTGKADELVGQFAAVADGYVTRATQVLREKNSDELLLMARDEFKARPLAIAAGFFALGFFGARLLRS